MVALRRDANLFQIVQTFEPVGRVTDFLDGR